MTDRQRKPWLLAERLRSIRLSPIFLIPILLLFAGGAARLEAAMTVSVVSDTPSPAPVGTVVLWSAQVSGASPGNLWYRFREREAGGDFRVIRDYSPRDWLIWTSLEEDTFDVELSVQDRTTLEVAVTSTRFFMVRRAGVDQAVVVPTTQPLVFLYSSPGCAAGRASVQIQSADGVVRTTSAKTCAPGRSLNFYLAGLAANADYSARLVVDRGRDVATAPPVKFSTGGPPPGLSSTSVLTTPEGSASNGILLEAPLNLPPIATDLNGNLLWSGPTDLSYLTYPGPDGTFFGILENGTDLSRNVVRQFDLVGLTVRETSVARVNEQLASMGRRQINGFHHEARPLNDGRTVILGDVEQILTDVQGPGPVDVIGDMIIVLDSDFQVVWTWDAFDHLDTSRRAVLGETCVAVVGCAPYFLSGDANDWTHGNSVSETPDGGLLYSARHQDWVIKVDYGYGSGSGDVIWRLGKDGDFAFDSADPYPWFSHQHDAAYEPGNGATIALFDNGNTRKAIDPNATSRGQAIVIDEDSRTARLSLSVDLGVFSQALGAAQKLSDGSYHFDAGFVLGALGPEALSIQIDGSQHVLSSIQFPAPVYRSFRLANLYGVSDEPAPVSTRLVDFHD